MGKILISSKRNSSLEKDNTLYFDSDEDLMA